MKKGEKERLKGERMVRGEGIGRFEECAQDGKANGDAEKDNDPGERERNESRGARDVPDPGRFGCFGKRSNGGCRGWHGFVERIGFPEYFRAVIPAVGVGVDF